MKHFWFAVSVLTGSLIYPSIAPAQTASGALLQQMNSASQTLDYEIAFISISKQGIDSSRYRHVRLGKESLAQLLQMDGPRREILQRGNEISYFEAGLEPFTLTGDHIVDALPALAFSDYGQLTKYYDFIPVGRARIADRASEVIRIVARDGTRYSYIVWIDEATKLPLRADLLDRDGETLEQFRVISFVASEQVEQALSGLQKAQLPPLLSIPATEKVNFSWAPKWLPAGVTEVSRSRRTLPNLPLPIESRLYSDGLFSFSVNISTSASPTSEQFVRQGRRTVHTEIRDGREITVVGELPPSTAKRIADSIVLTGSQ